MLEVRAKTNGNKVTAKCPNCEKLCIGVFIGWWFEHKESCIHYNGAKFSPGDGDLIILFVEVETSNPDYDQASNRGKR